MGAYNNLDTAIAGLKIGVGFADRVETFKAAEVIAFGSPVFVYEGDELNGYNVKQDVSTITLDADLVTSNVITTILTIDGVAQSAVASTFDTDHDTTMDNHEAALEAAFSGLAVTLTDATNNRQFTLTYKGVNMSLVTSVVTLGASQAGVTIAYTNGQVFAGVALFSQKGYVDNVGQYNQYDAMNVLSRGQLYVNTGGAVNANTDAYVVWDGTSANQKKFSGTASGNYVTNCKFRSTLAAAGLALLEVNGQNKDATP